MSAAMADLDVQLVEVLKRNHATYQALDKAYESTGADRVEQAKRWLSPLLRMIDRSTQVRLLELGPADGYLTGYLCELGFDVTAIDFAESMCAATRRHAPRARVIHDEFLAHRFTSSYDVVLVSAFAHMFPAPWDKAVLAKTRELMTDDGLAYLATTLHSEYSAGYLLKRVNDLAPVRFRVRHTVASFDSLIGSTGLNVGNHYATRDRLSPEKTWGNWIVTRSPS